MKQKLAVAILHGAGTPEENFASEMIEKICKGFADRIKVENLEQEVIFEPV